MTSVDRRNHAGDVTHEGEPWGKRLWLTLAAVVVVASCLQSYGISSWPLADDEVPSLVELDLLHIDAARFFSVPAAQIQSLPKATIVWNTVLRHALALLPDNEVSYRIPSLVFGILTSALVFLLAARWRGLWFALALSIVVNGSQLFVYLAQVNRYYSLTLLFLTLSFASLWLPWRGAAMILATALFSVLAVLSHNLTVAFFGLAFAAACAAYVLGRVPSYLVLRSGAGAVVSALLYLLYLRPLIQGWSSTGNPTPVLVSFAAYAGMPILALSLLGCWLSLFRRDEWPSLIWWTMLFAGSLCVFHVPIINWNPRYFLFFMPAMWVLAAHATEFIARRLGRGALGVVWYGCVILLLLPSLLSHFQDGSRHDYRQAAAVVLEHARAGQPILSDDAETISYYLPEEMRERLRVRTKARRFPESEFFLVCRSNAWTPLPQIPNRQLDLIAEIYRRRYDQFSHILRVYRVARADQAAAAPEGRDTTHP
jgi:hypothetical protein